MVVLKTLFKWIVLPIVALLIIISLSLVVTGNAYIFRGLQLTYLKGENTANIDDIVKTIDKLKPYFLDHIIESVKDKPLSEIMSDRCGANFY